MSTTTRVRSEASWLWYWHVVRSRERFVSGVAARLPRWLKYRAYIDVAAEVTTGPLRDRTVPEVTMVEVLEAYEVRPLSKPTVRS